SGGLQTAIGVCRMANGALKCAATKPGPADAALIALLGALSGKLLILAVRCLDSPSMVAACE
ncbi:MAG: hypothetical protein WA735_21700, partial [Candidatus Acidiferrales bacterium]